MRKFFQRFSSLVGVIFLATLFLSCASKKPAPDTQKIRENARRSFDSLRKEEGRR